MPHTSSQTFRRALIEAHLIGWMVALPGQLFTHTQIPACIWFLTKNNAKCARPGAAALSDHRSETLFIDTRKLGFMKDRVLRDFTKEDIEKIAGTFRAWRASANSTYADASGFSKSATLPEIISHGQVLTLGRCVGAEDVEDDEEGFDSKMSRLIAQLTDQFVESAKLDQSIKANLKGLGYAL